MFFDSNLYSMYIFTNEGEDWVGSFIISKNLGTGNYSVNFRGSETQKNLTFEICNSWRQVVIKENIADVNGIFAREFDLVSHGKGVYLVSISSGNERIVKCVVEY